jgi:hypothetical protein
VNGKGWKSLYKSDEQFCLRVKMIIAIGMVPADQKLRVLNDVWFFLRSDERIVILLDSYFLQHWVERVPFGLWTWFNVQVRTNNHMEGWHSGLKRKFPQGHPPLWDFLVELRNDANVKRTDIDLHNLGGGSIETRKFYEDVNKKMMTQCSRFYSTPSVTFLQNIAKIVPKPSGVTGLPAC